MESQYESIVTALTDLLVEGGFEAVSVRVVAARAHVSIGSVQHHFPTKDAMLQAATDRLGAVFLERLRAAADGAGAPQERLRAAVLALVNPTPQDRRLSVLWTLRMARAAVHEPTAKRHRYDRNTVEKLLADLVAQCRGDLSQTEAKAAAAMLLAFADGLACSVAVEPARVPPERAVAMIQAQLWVMGLSGGLR
jgi:AcrR family transcriptional regulator